jgi:hypothetical protein
MEESVTWLPEGVFIKINPWWKFWLWLRKPVRIPMIKQLFDTAVYIENQVREFSVYDNSLKSNDDGMIRRYQEAVK